MMLKQCHSLEDLCDFPYDISLSLYERSAVPETEGLFSALMQNDFSVSGFVSKKHAVDDIDDILKKCLPSDIGNHPAYDRWIQDMAHISCTFCDLQQSEEIGFWLGTKRGCKRYHLDYVPMRLLVTYAGAGTEWIPHEVSNWDAYENGGLNEDICMDVNKTEQLNPWTIALFRGHKQGILHRTPDDALNNPSLLMRLDNAEFQERLLKRAIIDAV